jgi:hypothetical protein
LPFLRFTRDKRGYETTSLVELPTGRQGRGGQRLLYWFRTPPGVKVGRPALDQDAIRWIEEHNPEIEFDWPKILEATPPASAVDEASVRRSRRAKTERRPAATQRPAQRRVQTPPPSTPPLPLAITMTPVMPEEIAEQLEPEGPEDDSPLLAVAAVDAGVGPESLVRLRARYAELQARIAERGGDAANIDALRAQAEPLNPDSWVTHEDVRKGLAEFESKIRDLRASLGLSRRRRSRRGGRRRRSGRQPQPGEPGQTIAADPSSDSSATLPGDGTDRNDGTDDGTE